MRYLSLARWLLLFFVPVLTGCTGLPKGVSPVSGFELNRYLGTWYEIARLDHRFERGLQAVTAHYSLLPDGHVEVVNSGYSTQDNERTEAVGKARFVGDPDTGHLKVSFFGPFYASYVVFELDKQGYDYAFVSGNNKKYLWLLARSPELDPAVIEKFRQRAGKLGFPVQELIMVDHSVGAASS